MNDRGVDETTGERQRFRSAILAPWCRKNPKVSEVLPLMYLHGMSSGDFVPALGEFFGSDAGLSPSVITRLTTSWQDERDRFSTCATVRLRTKVTKGPGSKAAGLAMAYKPIGAAQARWRAVKRPPPGRPGPGRGGDNTAAAWLRGPVTSADPKYPFLIPAFDVPEHDRDTPLSWAFSLLLLPHEGFCLRRKDFWVTASGSNAG